MDDGFLFWPDYLNFKKICLSLNNLDPPVKNNFEKANIYKYKNSNITQSVNSLDIKLFFALIIQLKQISFIRTQMHMIVYHKTVYMLNIAKLIYHIILLNVLWFLHPIWKKLNLV